MHENNVNRVKAKGKTGKVKSTAWVQLRINSVQNEIKSSIKNNVTKQGIHKGRPSLRVFNERLDVVLGDTGGWEAVGPEDLGSLFQP